MPEAGWPFQSVRVTRHSLPSQIPQANRWPLRNPKTSLTLEARGYAESKFWLTSTTLLIYAKSWCNHFQHSSSIFAPKPGCMLHPSSQVVTIKVLSTSSEQQFQFQGCNLFCPANCSEKRTQTLPIFINLHQFAMFKKTWLGQLMLKKHPEQLFQHV